MSLIAAIARPQIFADESGLATRIVRKGMLVILLMFGGFSLWATLAPLSGAVITDGKVKFTANRKTIQHLEGGLIKEILVRDGDRVKQGQTLLLLEDTRNLSEVTILHDQQDTLLVKEARLLAEKSLAGRIAFPQTVLAPESAKRREIMAKESALFVSRRRMLDDQVALLQSELAHTRDGVVSYQEQLAAIDQNIKYKQEQVAMRENLLEKNFVGKADLLIQKQSLTDKKEQYSAQSAELNNTRARMSGLQLRIVDVKNKYIQDADTELKETSRQLFELSERVRPAEDAMTRRAVTAPIDGQVIALKVSTVGGVVSPGLALMDIVPLSDDLVVEVRVKNTDIDSIFAGQAADVQLNAYNQRTTPTVNGTVVFIAGDALDDPQTGVAYYTAHVKIDQNALKNLQDIKIEAGMPVTAYIKTADRTMLQYLASPITQRMRHALREN